MKFYFLLLPVLLIFSCEKDNYENSLEETHTCRYASFNDAKVINDFSQFQTGILPFNFKNYWVYSNKYWDPDGNIIDTSIDTVYAEETIELNGHIWWYFKNAFYGHGFSTKYITQVDDTLFGLWIGHPSPPSNCVDMIAQIRPIGTDTVYKSYTIEGNVFSGKEYLSDSTITTPSGNYSNCYVYEINEYISAIEFFKPGLGYIKIITIREDRRREVTLIDYHIEP